MNYVSRNVNLRDIDLQEFNIHNNVGVETLLENMVLEQVVICHVLEILVKNVEVPIIIQSMKQMGFFSISLGL